MTRDDAISREYLFKVLDDFCGHDRTATITFDTLADLVYDMPPVEQEPKTGHWYSDCRDDYFICNQCRAEFERFSQGGYELIDDYNYCPNCGAKMESEDKG